MNNKFDIKKYLKYIGYLIVGVLVIISVYDAIKPSDHLLTIQVTPNDSTIKIDDKSVATGYFSGRMKKGNYTVLATKDGYSSEVRNVNLDKAAEIQITLNSISSSQIETAVYRSSPYDKVSLRAGSGLIGIDSSNGNLVTKSGNINTTLHNGPVKDFSVQGDIVAVLDNRNLSEVIILNKSTNESRRLDLSAFSPVISVSLSDDTQTLYFLAQFDIEKKNPTLYSISVSGGTETEITETRALKVEYLKDNLVILYEDVHAIDRGRVYIIDTEFRQEVFSSFANSYTISPNKTYMTLQLSRTFEIIDVQNFSTREIEAGLGDFIAWKDDNTLIILRNKSDAIQMATVNLNPFLLSSFSTIIIGKHVQNFYGVFDNKVTFQEYEGNTVLTFDLPR